MPRTETSSDYPVEGIDDMPLYKGNESFRHILDDTVPSGVLDAITVTDEGGLNISWTAGEIYDPADAGAIVDTTPGSGACTDDDINYLIWASGTGLTLGTTPADRVAGEVGVAHLACQNGDIYELHEDPLTKKRAPFLVQALHATLPVVVGSGLDVVEDTDVTNTHDVRSMAGEYYLNMNDPHAVAAIDTKTTDLERWWRTNGVVADWSNDQDAEIDLANWDQKTVGKTATGNNRWYKGLFLVSPTAIHWIYPQEEFNTKAQAIDAAIPTIPAGLALFPLSTCYVFQHGETAMAAHTSPQWIDVRPMIGAGQGGTLAAHALIDHTDRVDALIEATTTITLTSPAIALDGETTLGGDLVWDGNDHQVGGNTTMAYAATDGIEVDQCRTFWIQAEDDDPWFGFTTIVIQKSGSEHAANGPNIQLRRSRGTIASPTKVLDGDQVGAFSSGAYANGQWDFAGRVSFHADDDATATVVPTNIGFDTTDGAVISQRLLIHSDGNILVTGGELHFGSSASYITDAGTALKLVGQTDVQLFAGANRYLKVYASGMDFGASNYTYAKMASFTLSLGVGTAASPTSERIKFNADGISFNAATPAAPPTWTVTNDTPDRAIDCDGAGEPELRDIVGTMIKDLIASGLWQAP